MESIAIVGRTPALLLRAERYALLDDATVQAVVPCDDKNDTGRPERIRQELSSSPTEVYPHILEYESLANALAAEGDDIDGIDIASPALIVDDALDSALNADAPIICTPPLVNDPGRLDDARSHFSELDTWVMNGNPHRYSRFYEQLEKQIEAGAIGTLGVARIKRGVPHLNQGWNSWYVEGGSLIDGVMAYDFDLLTEMFGPIKRVFSRVGDEGSTVHAHVLLRFQSGATGQVEATPNRSESSPEAKIEFSGNHGRVIFSEETSWVRYRVKGQRDPSVPADDCYTRMIRAFLDCVRDGDSPQSGVSDAFTTTRAVLAAERSAATGQPVRPTEVEQ